jgi:acetylornithine deacetylase
VAEFIASGQAARYAQVVVAEPTGCRAELGHRGFLSARGYFEGVGGHSSEPRALADNAIHRLATWCTAALDAARADAERGQRSCFNIGTVSGGHKSNIIADKAEVFWSARLPPGDSNEALLARLKTLPGGEHAQWKVSFSGPPLPTAGNEAAAASAQSFATRHGLAGGDGLDFWTEASLFGAAGIPALVLGPGEIAQAHARDERVALAQLEKAAAIYLDLVNERV